MNENNEQFIYILYEHGQYIGIQSFNLSNQRGRKERKVLGSSLRRRLQIMHPTMRGGNILGGFVITQKGSIYDTQTMMKQGCMYKSKRKEILLVLVRVLIQGQNGKPILENIYMYFS